jgi:hypothetical protein
MMNTRFVQPLDCVTQPAATVPAVGQPANHTQTGPGSISATAADSKNYPRSCVIRQRVPVAARLLSGFVPIGWTMDCGRPVELRYADALYTLSDWCNDFVARVSTGRPGAVLLFEIAAIAQDLAHLYYDPKTNWWVYVAEQQFPVLSELPRRP